MLTVFVGALLALSAQLRAAAADSTIDPGVGVGADADRAKLHFFESEVRPILANRCYECHGAKKQKAGLRLDHISTIVAGGETGPALVRGNPDDSLLIDAIRYKNEDLQMPPDDDPLPAAEVAVLEKWVALGAPWPADDLIANDTKGPRDEHGFTAGDRAFWSFRPLSNPQPPALASATTARWAANDIDRFIAAKHAELGLAPAPAAGKRELVRRVYYDVHGLPPTPAQIEQFVNDPAPDAYARLVDALLASPRYGERWAQHWLDLVRYAESDGYRADAYRPGAWPYRDYVIQSFNSDKPYDQFVREQLAGDEIDPQNPEVLVATSYLRNPIYEWNQRDVRGQAELIVTDMTDNAGEVFLGLSMGCARCHDHKFDPILQQDYFSLRAFFEPVLWRSDLKLATPAEQADHAKQLAQWEAATAPLRAERDALIGRELERLVKRAYDRFTADIRTMIDKPPAERAPHEHVLATLAQRQMEYEHERFDPLKALKTPEQKARFREIEAGLKEFDHLKPQPLLDAFVATDCGPVAPPTMMKARRGGEREVAPAFLTLLDPNPPQIVPLPDSTGRRTALAQWITRPDNPLSTRVIVNRVWQYHFGRGLAGTPNDLGHLGERPTHPELLDWMTRRFVAGGWQLKPLHRDILLSATYRQTARHTTKEAELIDPSNKFLWRYSPRRLDAEQARDAILAATRELDITSGGRPEDAHASARRAIYTIKKRNKQNELLRSLDAPAGFTSIADRQQTSTPLQALLFMNGDWLLARSRTLGAVVSTIDEVWQQTLGRAPVREERRLAEAFLTRRIAGATPSPDAASREPVVMLDSGTFHENTTQERVLVRDAPKEGDDFTIEVIVTPTSIDGGTAVRTIASRWNGEKSSLEAHGWSLGLTGEKSAFKSRQLLLQLVGEDENMNTTYEAVAPGIPLELQKTYHLVVTISCTDRTANFIVRDLGAPEAPARAATARHAVIGKLGTGEARLVIGGLSRRSPHQFDGRIAAVRVAHGASSITPPFVADPRQWPNDGLIWRAEETDTEKFTWSGGTGAAESRDPRVRAMSDLAHVLLNSNEFLHLH